MIFARSKTKPIISCSHAGNWRNVYWWFMIINPKRALNIFLVSDLLTLLTALSHLPNSQFLLLSEKLKTSDSSALSFFYPTLQTQLYMCPASFHPFSYSREVILNPPNANHPICPQIQSPATFSDKMPPSIISSLSCVFCWSLSSGFFPSTFKQAQIGCKQNQKTCHTHFQL